MGGKERTRFSTCLIDTSLFGFGITIEDYTYDPDFDSQTLGTIERKHAGSWTKAIGGGRITPHPKST